MNADIDFRLQALEKAGAAAPAVASATAPAATTSTASAPAETAPQPAPAETTTASVAPPEPALGSQPGVLGTLPADPQTGELMPAVNSGVADTPEAQYQAAFALLRQAKYPEAEGAFKAFLQRFPDGPLAGNAQYWLGETFYVRGDFQNAAVAFAQGYQRYPDSSKAPDNLLKLSMSLSELGRAADACAALNQLQAKFPTLPGKIADRAQQQRQRNQCA
jgi:tol-pal system protein YbgF